MPPSTRPRAARLLPDAGGGADRDLAGAPVVHAPAAAHDRAAGQPEQLLQVRPGLRRQGPRLEVHASIMRHSPRRARVQPLSSALGGATMRRARAITVLISLAFVAGGAATAPAGAQAPPRDASDPGYTFAVIGDVPYGGRPDRGLPRLDPADQRRPGGPLGRPPRRHQERLVGVQRRLLPADPQRLRHLRGPAGLHPGRQRVDRLPPRQQRRLQPAGAAGRGPQGLLRPPGPHPGPGHLPGDLAGRPRLPGERHLPPRRRHLRGRERDRAATTASSPGPASATPSRPRSSAGGAGPDRRRHRRAARGVRHRARSGTTAAWW